MQSTSSMQSTPTTSIQLLRHATFVLQIGGKKLLIDPMLAAKSAYPPIPFATNKTPFPMVDLPLSDSELDALLREVDAVVVTHTHPDHWDTAAHQRIAKTKPILCQAKDERAIRGLGFSNVTPIAASSNWEGITIHRIGGRHGKGLIGKMMGTVSGFVFEQGEQSVYVAGDTIWCKEVQAALVAHQPRTIVLNGGAAQFRMGKPITMGATDMQQVRAFAPKARIIAVHLDTVNHCYETRPRLAAASSGATIEIPNDGDTILL